MENQRKMQIFSEKLPEFEWFPTFSKSNLNLFAQFFSYMDELYAANHGETLRSGEIRDELKRGHSSSHKKQKRDFFRQLLPRTHTGAVVLLHSTSRTNAEILNELIGKWKAEGYHFGTVEELFANTQC